MRKAFAVFKREYLEVVRKKSFIIMTLVAPFLFGALMFVPALLAVRGMGPKQVAVIDGTGRLGPVFARGEKGDDDERAEELSAAPAGKSAGQAARRLALRYDYVAAAGKADAVAQPFLDGLRRSRGEGAKALDGVLVIPADAFTDTAARLAYYSRSSTDFITQERLGRIVNRAVSRERLAAVGVDREAADRLLTRLPVDGVQVSRSGEQRKGGELDFLVGLLFAALLMIPMLSYGNEIMRGIVQEKTDRVVEILVSSMSPFQLLSGKVSGLAAVGLTQVGIWLVMGTAMMVLGGGAAAAAGANVATMVQPRVLPYFFVFYVLGYLIYVCIYAVGGAISNSEKEAQQILGPLMIVIMIPWFLAMPIIQSPDSKLAVVLSLVPVFTPITMFIRVLVSEPPLWQLAASISLSLLTIVGMFYVTGKIFRVGILSYGKRPTLPELVRWLKAA